MEPCAASKPVKYKPVGLTGWRVALAVRVTGGLRRWESWCYCWPSASADGWRVEFPDGAVIEYEPDTGKLTVSGIKIADVTASASVVVTCPSVTVTASQKITLDTPEVICTNKLTTGSIEVKKGCVERGGSWTVGTK